MKTTVYLSVAEVLQLHARLILDFGGSPGIRDVGLIESALARARSGYYRSLMEQAAALLQSFAMNHAFVDGNNHMAIATALIFLRLNGCTVRIPAKNGEQFILGHVIAKRCSLGHIAQWLATHRVP